MKLKQTESQFMAMVIQLATLLNWKVYHTRMSKGSDIGYPDLTLIRRERLVVAELKKDGEVPTRAQQEWLDAFIEAGVEAYAWWPNDLPQIQEVLR